MNNWERYQMQQASYNLIAIVTKPKVIVLFLVLGFLMQLYFSHLKEHGRREALKFISERNDDGREFICRHIG